MLFHFAGGAHLSSIVECVSKITPLPHTKGNVFKLLGTILVVDKLAFKKEDLRNVGVE